MIDVDNVDTSFIGSESFSNILSALFVFVALYLLKKATSPAINKFLVKANVDSSLRDLIVNKIYSSAIFVLGILMAASTLGVDITAAIAGFGVLGIAVGLAAQDTLSNIIAGLMIFWDKPFKLGDWIEVDDKFGKVSKITLRTTRIRTLDNTYVVIPNLKIIDEMLVNHSKHGETRITIPVSIAYGESIDKARQTLMKVLEKEDRVMKEPEADVVVVGMGDSAVELALRVWVKDSEHEIPVRFALVEESKKALDKAKIEIPYPHRVIISKN